MLPHPKEEEEDEEAMFHGDLCNNTSKTKPIVIESDNIFIPSPNWPFIPCLELVHVELSKSVERLLARV